MFSKATSKFLRQVDPDGHLIKVSRLNDSHKLVATALVVKRKRFWFWQPPKYQPSDFTLSDILMEQQPLCLAVSGTPFLKYDGTYGDTLRAKLGAKATDFKVILEKQGSSKLQLSFGELEREQVDVKKLLLDSGNRRVDMQHVLVQQLQKHEEVLAVVKERILTTSVCTISEMQRDTGRCGGVLGIASSTVEVCVRENSSVEQDSEVSMEIPQGTVIAYSLLELEIKKDGRYELCLQPGTPGGFEADSGTSSRSYYSFVPMDTVDGMESNGTVQEQEPLSALRNEELETYLQPLADLPPMIRSALLQIFAEVLEDRANLSYLEHVLEEWCRGEASVSAASAVNHNSACVLLGLLGSNPANHSETGRPSPSPHLTAAHLLVSAMEGLPDEVRNLLSKASSERIDHFNTLITSLMSTCESLPIKSLPQPLQEDEALHWAQHVFSLCNMRLSREMDKLWARTEDKSGALPLVLRITVRGLSLLHSE